MIDALRCLLGWLACAGACAFLWLLSAPGSSSGTGQMQKLGIALLVLHVLSLFAWVGLLAAGRPRLAAQAAVAPLYLVIGGAVLASVFIR